MDAQQQRGLGPDRAVVVGRARAVRRPDLAQDRARPGEDVGDAKAVPDLDQLAARDEHLASLGERRQREHDRGGVVVDDERGLRAGQPAEDARRRGPAASRAHPTRGRTRDSSIRAAVRTTSSRASSASGARPRFVCTTTPVALIVRRNRARRAERELPGQPLPEGRPDRLPRGSPLAPPRPPAAPPRPRAGRPRRGRARPRKGGRGVSWQKSRVAAMAVQEALPHWDLTPFFSGAGLARRSTPGSSRSLATSPRSAKLVDDGGLDSDFDGVIERLNELLEREHLAARLPRRRGLRRLAQRRRAGSPEPADAGVGRPRQPADAHHGLARHRRRGRAARPAPSRRARTSTPSAGPRSRRST